MTGKTAAVLPSLQPNQVFSLGTKPIPKPKMALTLGPILKLVETDNFFKYYSLT